MVKLKEEMGRLAAKKQGLKALEEEISHLKQKSSDLSARVEVITTALGKAKNGRDEALLQFTRDEINEDQLAALKDETPVLKSHKANFEAALEVVNQNIDNLQEKKKGLQSDIRQIQAKALYLIRDRELVNAAMSVKTAYIATTKSVGSMTFSEFLNSDSVLQIFARSASDIEQINRKIEEELS